MDPGLRQECHKASLEYEMTQSEILAELEKKISEFTLEPAKEDSTSCDSNGKVSVEPIHAPTLESKDPLLQGESEAKKTDLIDKKPIVSLELNFACMHACHVYCIYSCFLMHEKMFMFLALAKVLIIWIPCQCQWRLKPSLTQQFF